MSTKCTYFSHFSNTSVMMFEIIWNSEIYIYPYFDVLRKYFVAEVRFSLSLCRALSVSSKQ